jgi:hypothetical protein
MIYNQLRIEMAGDCQGRVTTKPKAQVAQVGILQ